MRLTAEDKQMLQECAVASNASLTDMVRWLIRQYHQEHVKKRLAQAAAVRTAKKR